VTSFLFLAGAITPLPTAAAEEEQPVNKEIQHEVSSEMDGESEIPPKEEVSEEATGKMDGQAEVPQQEEVPEGAASEMDEDYEVPPEERGFIDETIIKPGYEDRRVDRFLF